MSPRTISSPDGGIFAMSPMTTPMSSVDVNSNDINSNNNTNNGKNKDKNRDKDNSNTKDKNGNGNGNGNKDRKTVKIIKNDKSAFVGWGACTSCH